jgi:uncharacterized protein (TIGR02118 family)
VDKIVQNTFEESVMVRVSVLYAKKESYLFDHDYYRDNHMPLVASKLTPFGLLSTSVDKTATHDEPFVCIGYMTFNSISDWQKGFGAVGEELVNDAKNYTNLEPIIQIGEVVY